MNHMNPSRGRPSTYESYESLRRQDVYGRFTNLDGLTSPVVHQYDRFGPMFGASWLSLQPWTSATPAAPGSVRLRPQRIHHRWDERSRCRRLRAPSAGTGRQADKHKPHRGEGRRFQNATSPRPRRSDTAVAASGLKPRWLSTVFG